MKIPTSSSGEMTWRPNGGASCGILHLRPHPSKPWRPYTEFPEYAVADRPGFSDGYTTFLALLKQKWKLL